MKLSLQKKLTKNFNFYPPFFSIHCGSGWFSLIDELNWKLLIYIKDNNLEDFQITCIKEKFGGLYIEVNGTDTFIDKLIMEIEEKSLSICEYCGNPGVTSIIGGWPITVCDRCFFKN
jgi:hypothetical protein